MPSIDATMKDIIVLDDDDEWTVSSSQVQRGLSEVQKSRMMQQKQLALARLQAKKLQQTQLPFGSGNPTALPQKVSSTSGSGPWAGDSKVLASTSASNGWRAGPAADEWQHSRLPNQGYHDYPPRSGLPHCQSSYATSGNADVRWDDRIDDRGSLASSACKDGITRVVPNRNQECWDADFHRYAHDVSRSSGFQQNSTHVSTEVVGEWRSVRKRPAPGSSFGVQMSASSDHFKPSSEPELWQILKSPKRSVDAACFKSQLPGIYIDEDYMIFFAGARQAVVRFLSRSGILFFLFCDGCM